LASSASPERRSDVERLDSGLAEKPKVEELQMDWLRSEDLKEENNELPLWAL